MMPESTAIVSVSRTLDAMGRYRIRLRLRAIRGELTRLQKSDTIDADSMARIFAYVDAIETTLAGILAP